MSKTTNDYELIAKRFTHCENCGSGEYLEIHHVLYHRMKGRTWLNVIENCAMVCHACHAGGFASNMAFKERHWAKRNKEGYKMREWMDNLPLKTKEYFGK